MKLRYILWYCCQFAFVSVFGKECGPAEYKTHSGECCPMCGKGLVVYKDCTLDSSTTCIPCIQGTFMNEPNGLNKCFQCKTCDPGQGLSILKECTTTSDAVCDVLDGFYCPSDPGKECSFALKHSTCSPGQRIKVPGTKITDTVCQACAEGHYSKYGINCTAWTNCEATRGKKIKDGSLTEDVVCQQPAERNRICFLVSFLLLIVAILILVACIIHNRRTERPKPLRVPVQETQRCTETRRNVPVETEAT